MIFATQETNPVLPLRGIFVLTSPSVFVFFENI